MDQQCKGSYLLIAGVVMGPEFRVCRIASCMHVTVCVIPALLSELQQWSFPVVIHVHLPDMLHQAEEPVIDLARDGLVTVHLPQEGDNGPVNTSSHRT